LTTRRTVAQTHTDMKQLRSGQTVSDMKKGESSNKSGFAYHSFGLGFSCALLSVVTENTFPYKTIGRINTETQCPTSNQHDCIK